MLQSMALHPVSQFFLGTRIPGSEFALPSNSSLQLRKTRVWARGELDILEAHPNIFVSDSQEPQYPEPTNKYNGTSHDRLLGQDEEHPASSNRRGNEFEDDEETKYYHRGAPRTRDLWVRPGLSLATDPSRIAERKEFEEKYTWVNPNRKSTTGGASWAERRAGIEMLNSTRDVATALLEWVISLPVMISSLAIFSE